MVVLIPIQYLELAEHTFPVYTHEVSEVLWAYLGWVWVVDMVVLIPIFGASTTHIPSGHT